MRGDNSPPEKTPVNYCILWVQQFLINTAHVPGTDENRGFLKQTLLDVHHSHLLLLYWSRYPVSALDFVDLGPLLPEVTVTVVDEGEDVAGSDEPEVVTMVGIEVTMVTRVGADPIDDDVYNNYRMLKTQVNQLEICIIIHFVNKVNGLTNSLKFKAFVANESVYVV